MIRLRRGVGSDSRSRQIAAVGAVRGDPRPVEPEHRVDAPWSGSCTARRSRANHSTSGWAMTRDVRARSATRSTGRARSTTTTNRPIVDRSSRPVNAMIDRPHEALGQRRGSRRDEERGGTRPRRAGGSVRSSGPNGNGCGTVEQAQQEDDDQQDEPRPTTASTMNRRIPPPVPAGCRPRSIADQASARPSASGRRDAGRRRTRARSSSWSAGRRSRSTPRSSR